MNKYNEEGVIIYEMQTNCVKPIYFQFLKMRFQCKVYGYDIRYISNGQNTQVLKWGCSTSKELTLSKYERYE